MPRHTTRYNQKCDDRHKFDELIPLEIKALQAFAISNGVDTNDKVWYYSLDFR